VLLVSITAIITNAQNTYYADTCAYVDVNDCVNGSGANTCHLGTPTGPQNTHTAVNGDVVIMPTCTNTSPNALVGNTWGDGTTANVQRLVIHAGITLKGQDNPGGSQGGANQTIIIQNNYSGGASGGPFPPIQVADTVTAAWRICCFTIRANQQNGPLSLGLINIGNSGSHAFRIDHMELDTDQFSAPGIIGDDGSSNCDNLRRWEGMALGGDSYGVVDHNLYQTCRRRIIFRTGTTFADFSQTFSHANKSWSVGESLGMPGFPANTYQPGTDANACGGTQIIGCQAAIVIEDNTVTQLATNTGSNAIGCEQGARCVSRFNNLQCCIGQHGLEQDNTQGNRQHEAYGNTVTLPSTNRGGATNAVGFANRGGIALYFENILTNSSLYSFGLAVSIDDTRYNGSTAPSGEWFNPWGPCNGSTSFTTSSGVVTTLNSTWDYSIGFPGTNPAPTPCMNQVGRGKGNLISLTGCPTCSAAGWPSELLVGSYYWGNNLNGTIDTGAYGSNGGTLGSPLQIKQNIDYYTGVGGGGTGTGATGVGMGPLASIPASCTITTSQDNQSSFTAYWATDQGNWNHSNKTFPDGTSQGILYKCGTSNLGSSPVCVAASGGHFWCQWYEPFTYPHPLVGSSNNISPAKTMFAGTLPNGKLGKQ